jgi:hypothetical protein
MSASRVAIVLGALGILAIPAAVALSWRLASVALLAATEVSVPLGFVLGLCAVALARRARHRVDRSVLRAGARLVRVAALLAWASVYIATIGAIALGFYGLLVARG